MTDLKKRKLKRIIFPIGIFFLLFLIESVIGIGGVASYIYLAGKKNIADIESYTINYSKTMAEAFADVAAFAILGSGDLKKHLPHPFSDSMLDVFNRYVSYITGSVLKQST
ncbi:MAG: hypothetical protein FWG49_05410 [Leptospirales bacterium]|nr:hypothetical protein [Leptospirales bacterium]